MLAPYKGSGHGHRANHPLESPTPRSGTTTLIELFAVFDSTEDLNGTSQTLLHFLDAHGNSIDNIANFVNQFHVFEKLQHFYTQCGPSYDISSQIQLIHTILCLDSELASFTLGQFLVQIVLDRHDSIDNTTHEALRALSHFSKTPSLFTQEFFGFLKKHLDSIDSESLLQLFLPLTNESKLYLQQKGFADFAAHLFRSLSAPVPLSTALVNLCSADAHIFDLQSMKRNWISQFRFPYVEVHKNMLEMCQSMTESQISVLSNPYVISVLKDVINANDDVRIIPTVAALRRYLELKPAECHKSYFEELDLDGTAVSIVRHVITGTFSLRIAAGHTMALILIEFSDTYGRIFRSPERHDLTDAVADAIQWTLECDDTGLIQNVLEGVSRLIGYGSRVGCLSEMRDCLCTRTSIISSLKDADQDYTLTIERLS